MLKDLDLNILFVQDKHVIDPGIVFTKNFNLFFSEVQTGPILQLSQRAEFPLFSEDIPGISLKSLVSFEQRRVPAAVAGPWFSVPGLSRILGRARCRFLQSSPAVT